MSNDLKGVLGAILKAALSILASHYIPPQATAYGVTPAVAAIGAYDALHRVHDWIKDRTGWAWL